MPVTGLPATLERTLNALMMDTSVSSWKVAGEGDNTIVVLRLKPVSNPATPTMAEPVLNRTTQVQYYRRKPPSQVRRDQERARQQQQRQASEKRADRDSAVNAVALLDTQPEERSTQDREDEHTLTCADHGDSENENDNATSNVSHMLDSFTAGQSEEDTEMTIDGSVAGFSTSVVKRYVATLTDRSVQRRLRDDKRNQCFRKVVQHQTDDMDALLRESTIWCSSTGARLTQMQHVFTGT
eukprot:TRINITY_DN39908_c0_g1_i2.p1 TRINITY_DN39908_c0_g1~~TRINITY_DN39908_c0_g1_i2.p1  ORF type:complete len:240 (+),score=42.45 TRINITY_DN39908_c0_g1_i2:91-810(+)